MYTVSDRPDKQTHVYPQTIRDRDLENKLYRLRTQINRVFFFINNTQSFVISGFFNAFKEHSISYKFIFVYNGEQPATRRSYLTEDVAAEETRREWPLFRRP